VGLFAEFIAAEKVEIAGTGGELYGLACLADCGCVFFFIDDEYFNVIVVIILF
jgi:hypothetical protein